MPTYFRRLMLCGAALLSLGAFRAVSAEEHKDVDPVRLVDTLVGSAVYEGATFVGAARPFSLIRLGPDTLNPSTAGYNPSTPILGFSHTHMSGAGGTGYYGNILVTPQIGTLSIGDRSSLKSDEHGEPGYYKVFLTRHGILAELTSTARVGYHRYTFPAGSAPRILIDLSATIDTGTKVKQFSRCTAAHGKFVSDRLIEGDASFVGDFAKVPYHVYFVAEVDRPASGRVVWQGDDVHAGTTEVESTTGQNVGMAFDFSSADTRPIQLRVALSFGSLDRARQAIVETKDESFDQVREAAANEWRSDLKQIEVDGGTTTQREQFYTALYHTALMPTDVTGDDPSWLSKEPQFTDIHAIWDTFRATYPLFTLIRPVQQQRIVRCLLEIYREKGWLPDYWRLGRYNGIQGGTNADVVIADAITKNLGGFDRELAYQAIRKDATIPTTARQFPAFGRFAPYFTLGYVPGTTLDPKGKTEYTNATSSTIEYAYDDFCVATVADALGYMTDAAAFRKQSLNAFALFHPEYKFFWSKNSTGEWLPGFTPDLNGPHPHGWNTPFYEATPWVYRFYAPHDMKGVINRIGGDKEFVAALDEYFDGQHDDPGNEPSFLTPWLYIYAGRPDKTSDRVDNIRQKDFHLAPSAYAGDDDSGSMSSWYIFATMGIYPNAGQDIYLLCTPSFERVTLRLGSSGKALTISAMNLTRENIYIQSATLNGKPWNQAWLRHADIIDGATLVYQMGPKRSDWGTDLRPPSLER